MDRRIGERIPAPEEPFMQITGSGTSLLLTDASESAIGAVLATEHPVA